MGENLFHVLIDRLFRYCIEWGDGSPITCRPSTPADDGLFQHIWSHGGVYLITATAYDKAGKMNSILCFQ